jgi:polysaccharide pyruvyl transferase WcaK-like protein
MQNANEAPPLRVGLLTTHQTNIGDDFIREGLTDVIKHLAPERRVDFISINKHEPHSIYPGWHPIQVLGKAGYRKFRFARRWIDRWAPLPGHSRFSSVDLIVQCGTPIIWDGCRNSGWANLIWRGVIARLAQQGKPVFNLGGGSCYPWERQPSSLAGHADESFVRLMLSAGCVTTVRDSLARRLLASLGYDVPQLCCPAILAGQIYTRQAEPSRKILINYMQGGGHYDWGQRIDRAAWQATMQKLVAELRKQDWRPLLLAHSPTEFSLAAELWPDLPRVLARNSAEYFGVIRDAAFGVFNRMHASVAAAGLGIPSVAIGTDTRNLMVEALSLPVFYVKEATTTRLLLTIDELVSKRDAESSRLLSLREVTRLQYQEYMRPVLANIF